MTANARNLVEQKVLRHDVAKKALIAWEYENTQSPGKFIEMVAEKKVAEEHAAFMLAAAWDAYDQELGDRP